MRILLFGKTGQLGWELQRTLPCLGEVTALDYPEVDFSHPESLRTVVRSAAPDVVINAVAYTNVDKAEIEPERTNAINAEAPGTLAQECFRQKAVLIHFSTDYVFDGLKEQPYTEDDQPDPKTEYGRTKRLGEEAVEKYSDQFYIIRTAWVFGNYGKNFVFTMQNLAKTHPKLTVVSDQHGRPTWTRTLAEFMTYLAENQKAFGYYHLSNDAKEDTTWYDFAKEILKDTDVEVLPVDSSQFPAKAKRPLNSTMSLAKAKATGFVIPTWQEALQEFYKQDIK